MRYSVVIVTYNSERWLDGCIKALAGADYPLSEIELIIVDNASSDGTLQKLEGMAQLHSFGTSLVLPQKQNGGFAKGCNTGAAAARGELLFFLNADTEVSPAVFTALDEAIWNAGDKAAAFECRQLPFETGHHIDPVTLRTEWASGAALAVTKAAFDAVNGFDRHLFMYCEDVDLSWRLRAKGYEIVYVPRAEVTHYAYEPKGGDSAAMKLGEYAGGFYGNLLLRYKFGSLWQIVQGHAMYLGALRSPQHFPNVRKVLAKNYLKQFVKLWPFLFWRLGHRGDYKAHTARFEGGFSPDRGLFKLQKPRRRPLVSVVIRTCNRPDTLRETLKSLQNQTYRQFEAIVVEDGPAQSEAVCNEFHGLNIRYHATGTPVGRSKAGNLGLSMARGEYMNFLDDDDYFYPDHLELLVSQATANPGADLITAASMAMEADVVSRSPYELRVRSVYPIRFDRLDIFLLCQSCRMPIQSILFKRWLFEVHGGLDERLDGDEDWAMWLRYFSVAKRIHTDRVDIPRATSVFIVPADKATAKARLDGYKQYEQAMLDDESIRFTVSARDMRNFYEGLLGDMRHLRATGKLNDFLDGNDE